jgi:hypothetical protein
VNRHHVNRDHVNGVDTGIGRSERGGRGNRSGRTDVNELTWSLVHATGRGRVTVNDDTKWPRR